MSVEKYQCRKCGEVHLITQPDPPWQPPAPASSSWQPVERRQVGMGSVGPVPNATEYWRETPTRPAAVGSDVAVPFLQSLISAAIIGGLLILPADRLDMPAWSVLVAAGVAFLVSWVILTGFYRGLLLQRESVVAEPPAAASPAPTKRVKLEVEEKNRRQFADLPLTPDQLRTVARAVIGGRAFSVSAMTGRGKPLSRAEYETLREWLLTHGYLRWIDRNNRQAGVTWRARGQALLRALAE